MNITKMMTDEAVLAETGKRIARYRIDQQMTQAALAEQAGVSKRTVERVEAGASVQFSTVIRILRILHLLPGLDRRLRFLNNGHGVSSHDDGCRGQAVGADYWCGLHI